MARNYTHFCPYCGTHLSVSHMSVEKTASRCPNCHRFLIVDAFGATIKNRMYIIALNVERIRSMMDVPRW